MGTRSLIGKLINDGPEIKAIYCHWDGYPEHNGKVLVNAYTTNEKVDELLELGDLSSLGPKIGTKIDFDSREASLGLQCVAYGRDRRENDTGARIARNLRELVMGQSDAEYIYIWNGTSWACYTPRGDMIDLTPYKKKETNNDMA